MPKQRKAPPKSQRAKRQVTTAPHTGETLWRPAFIAALSQHGNVTAAADHAKINRSHAYRVRNDDPEFAQQWDDAQLEAADRIEFEALRRAKRGVLKPVYYKGQRVGYEREYSDTLMGMMLKGHKPNKYRERIEVEYTMPPELVKLLKERNMKASEIWEAMIQELANENTPNILEDNPK